MKRIFIFLALVFSVLSSVAQIATVLPTREEGQKYITTEEIYFDLKEGEITESYYKTETQRKEGRYNKISSNSDEIIEVSSSLEGYLYGLLRESNFIDTTERIFPDYKNSLHLSMRVHRLEFSYIRPKSRKGITAVYLKMFADMELSSYYGKSLIKENIAVEELIANRDGTDWEIGFTKLIKNILIQFITEEKVEALIRSTDYFDAADISTFEKIDIRGGSALLDWEFLSYAVPTIITDDGHGSACVISSNGYLITNFHVVGQNETVKVKFKDGTVSEGKVLRKHPDCDLALLKVERDNLPALFPNAQDPEIGSTVYLMGTPADTLLSQSVFKGVISGRRSFADFSYIQTDAKVNPGNSGGAMFNERGELIGIVSSKYVGYGIEGIGFAVPIDQIRARLNVLLPEIKKQNDPVPIAKPIKSKKK
jgi:S1-C subfamily serine protease